MVKLVKSHSAPDTRSRHNSLTNSSSAVNPSRVQAVVAGHRLEVCVRCRSHPEVPKSIDPTGRVLKCEYLYGEALPRPIAGRTETNVMEYKSTRDQNQEQTKRLSAKAMITDHKDARGLPYFQSQLNAFINTNGGVIIFFLHDCGQVEGCALSDDERESIVNQLQETVHLQPLPRADLDKTDCEALSSPHCSDKDGMESMFWINEVVNFFSYAEPVFFALLLLIRVEFTGDTCPDPPKEEHEYPHESFEFGNPAIFYHEEEEQLYYGSSAEREPFVLRPEAKADGMQHVMMQHMAMQHI